MMALRRGLTYTGEHRSFRYVINVSEDRYMKYGECTWKDIETLNKRVVVLPLGSLEQHGHHLPLLTDTIICTELARRAEEALGDIALFLPTLWLGASDHHRGFAGTISISNRVYVSLVIDVLESMIAAGYNRIFLLNAHGGNHLPGSQAIYEVQHRYRDRPDLWLVFGSWMTMAAEEIAAIDELDQKHVTHACELETSIILRLYPELVKQEVAQGATIPFESAFYTPDFSRSSCVDVMRPFDHLSATGAFGHPEFATAEKGETLLAVAVDKVVSFVREFATWTTLSPH